MTNELIAERTEQMRAPSDADRRDAIAGAGNVIGFGRFRTVADRRGFAPAYPVRFTPEPA